MKTRVRIDNRAVERVAYRGAAARMARVASFLANEQRQATTSRRVRAQIGSESGRDAQGFYARAGMVDGTQHSPGFFWYFREYGTGRGPHEPFLRRSLESNTQIVARMIAKG